MIEFVRGAFSVSITRFVDPFAARVSGSSAMIAVMRGASALTRKACPCAHSLTSPGGLMESCQKLSSWIRSGNARSAASP